MSRRASSREMSASAWRMVLLASAGGMLEYYDFMLFGIFARDIGQAVFPSQDPVVSLIVTFTTFAIGYLARPLGGIVLGRLGDRMGRRGVFLASIFITSVATLGIGLVPTYASWGIVASLLVVVLRLTQGFCIGGELAGAITYVVETAPSKAPLVCSVVFCFVTTGVALATTIALIVQRVLPPEIAAAYGWRLAFVVGGAFGLASFWLRRAFEESPDFAELKRLSLASHSPVRDLFRDHSTKVLAGIGAQAVVAGFAGLFFAHMPAYLAGVLKYPAETAVFAQTYGVVLHAVLIVGVGWLAMRVSPASILRVGAVLLGVGVFPFYQALSGRTVDIFVLMTAAAVVGALSNGTFAMVTADLFPTRVRYTGVGVVQNISQTMFGGTAPLVATTLIRNTGQLDAPAWIVVVCAVLTVVGSVSAARYGGHVVGRQTSEPV